MRANTAMTRMMSMYTRRAGGQSYLKTLLTPLVSMVWYGMVWICHIYEFLARIRKTALDLLFCTIALYHMVYVVCGYSTHYINNIYLY